MKRLAWHLVHTKNSLFAANVWALPDWMSPFHWSIKKTNSFLLSGGDREAPDPGAWIWRGQLRTQRAWGVEMVLPPPHCWVTLHAEQLLGTLGRGDACGVHSHT